MVIKYTGINESCPFYHTLNRTFLFFSEHWTGNYFNIWAAFFPADNSDVRKPRRVDLYLFHRWLKWKESRLTLYSFQWCSMQTMTHLGNLFIIQLPKPDQHLVFIMTTNMFKDIEWSQWAESCGCDECGQTSFSNLVPVHHFIFVWKQRVVCVYVWMASPQLSSSAVRVATERPCKRLG